MLRDVFSNLFLNSGVTTVTIGRRTNHIRLAAIDLACGYGVEAPMSTMTLSVEQKQEVGFKRVLFATDFSSISQQAFACALPIVRHFHSEVSMIHVLPLDPGPVAAWDALPEKLDPERLGAEREMQRFAQEPPLRQLHPHLLVCKGRVSDVFNELVHDEIADLLVMGTHGRGGIKKLTLGSVTEEVMRLAACPVLSVGPHVPRADPEKTGFHSILFATDFGPASSKAFPYALSLAESFEAKLILLQTVPLMAATDTAAIAYCPGPCAVQDLVERQQARKEESAQRLQALVSRNRKLSQVECVVATEHLPEGILSTARLHNVDLIVMGANRTFSPRISAHVPWTFAHEVICKAECPVLTVCN